MRSRILVAVMGVTMLLGIVSANAGGTSVATLPPVVVKTVPTAGDTSVDPSLSEIRVTFSKDMMTDRMWSWCFQSRDTFPEVTDKNGIRYLDDKRTCILPVKLQPGKTYALWINTQKNTNFKDTNHASAVPYLLAFETAKAGGEENDAAISAAKQWLATIDSGQYAKSWSNAATLFKSALPATQWSQALDGVRKPLGSVVSRKVKSSEHKTSIPGAPDGDYVVIQFDTSFENKKTATETVTFMLDKDGTWRVSGYYIK